MCDMHILFPDISASEKKRTMTEKHDHCYISTRQLNIKEKTTLPIPWMHRSTGLGDVLSFAKKCWMR